jgi:hypothetical protein
VTRYFALLRNDCAIWLRCGSILLGCLSSSFDRDFLNEFANIGFLGDKAWMDFWVCKKRFL